MRAVISKLSLGAAVILLSFGSIASAAPARPLETVLPLVARQVPGTMLDALPPGRTQQDGLHYQIKWLTSDGRVVWLNVDARTGRVEG